ncbi:glycosyltransferase family 2 protein [Microbacterium sp. bgisy189]|uniref:glycosyltransferase family 2 protein n=1 Tax=Microbacterium sp. bgisy189 TaxID=3413798 RepID=UPI003EBDA414
MKNDRLRRFTGLAVIALTTLAAAGLMLVVIAADPGEFARPHRLQVADGWSLLYDDHMPPWLLVLLAVVLTVVIGTAIGGFESFVANRSRRSPEGALKRPISPRTIMAATRGVYAGEVTVTVLIPAHNEEKSLPITLASLKAQSTPPDRILVVADNCTDGTVQVARDAGADVIETVDNRHKKAGGLNQALRGLLPHLGDNDTVMVMDADTALSDRFIEIAKARFTADRALMAVGGLFHGEPGHGLLGQFQRNEYTRYSREIERRRGRVFVLTGAASLFRPAALRAVADSRGTLIPGVPGDVYDTVALTEDNELTIAIKSLGGLMTSPRDCTVVTELMPTWGMLWKQRLRWQRGAIENLAAYGVTPTTVRYWAQQIGIGYSVIALASYFLLIFLTVVALDEFVWFPFWITVGSVFVLERLVTVWRGGWRARVLSVFVLPELVFDMFLNVVFVKGIIDMSFGREAGWSHLTTAAKETSA